MLDAWAKPAPATYGATSSETRREISGEISGATGGGTAGPSERDPRTRPQRLHDALDTACQALLRSEELPDSGGVPATVIVYVDADRIAQPTGSGLTADGQRLSAAAIGRLMNEALVLPTVIAENRIPSCTTASCSARHSRCRCGPDRGRARRRRAGSVPGGAGCGGAAGSGRGAAGGAGSGQGRVSVLGWAGCPVGAVAVLGPSATGQTARRRAPGVRASAGDR